MQTGTGREVKMSEKGYVPPYSITDKTVNLISFISRWRVGSQILHFY